MADQGIDPRYAAQFQRGFDPAQHAATPVPTAAAVARDAPVRLLGGPPASAPRVEQVRPAPIAPPDEPRIPVADSVLEPPPAQDEEAPRAAFLEWALLGLGVALVIVAAAIFWQAATDTGMYTGVNDFAEQAFSSMRATLPGPLLVAGVTSVSLWIVLRAIGARR